jgi:Platelet-activating factor acetylhydrolase, isoform II
VLTSTQNAKRGIEVEEYMRLFEWLMVLLSIPAVGWTIVVRRAWPIWIRVITVGALLLLALHAFVEGAHWQMAPIYLGILLLLFPLLAQGSGRVLNRISLGQLLAVWAAGLLLLCGLAFCYTLPMFHLPRTTGPYPVATRTLFLVDPTRDENHPGAPHHPREVTVQLWYPSATSDGTRAAYRRFKETDLRSTYQSVLKTDSILDGPFANGRFPVILFNHAWRGFRNRSTYMLQELASQGFVVVGISHPYNAAIVELHDGSVADGRSQVDLGSFYATPVLTLEQRLALADAEMRIQTDDDKFVLDQLTLMSATDPPSGPSTDRPLAGHLDLTRVGAFGHSFGGNVSAELAREDSRVLSAIVLDGVLHGPVAESGLDKPLFRIKAETPDVPPGGENSPIQSTRVHAQMSKLGEGALASTFERYGGYQVVIRGIDHENFSDKGFFSPFHFLSGIGTLPQSRAAEIINAYAVAFFKQTLKNEPQPLLSGAKAPYPEVVNFQSWPRPNSAKEVPTTAQR